MTMMPTAWVACPPTLPSPSRGEGKGDVCEFSRDYSGGGMGLSGLGARNVSR